jgi:hypothetical protein
MPSNLFLNRFVGLSQKQLCDRLYLNYAVVSLSAKQMKLSTHEYLQQETGWIFLGNWYYPQDYISSILEKQPL